jgi:hypothetical protein
LARSASGIAGVARRSAIRWRNRGLAEPVIKRRARHQPVERRLEPWYLDLELCSLRAEFHGVAHQSVQARFCGGVLDLEFLHQPGLFHDRSRQFRQAGTQYRRGILACRIAQCAQRPFGNGTAIHRRQGRRIRFQARPQHIDIPAAVNFLQIAQQAQDFVLFPQIHRLRLVVQKHQRGDQHQGAQAKQDVLNGFRFVHFPCLLPDR